MFQVTTITVTPIASTYQLCNTNDPRYQPADCTLALATGIPTTAETIVITTQVIDGGVVCAAPPRI